MQPQFASAGNAKEKSTQENPVGLYRHPDGLEIGALDPAQGDAMVRQGFVLVEEGRKAAEKAGKSQEARDASLKQNPEAFGPVAEDEEEAPADSTPVEETTKKGKK